MGRLKAPKITGAKNLSEGQKRKRKRKNTFAKLDERLRTLKEKEQENPFETKISKSKFKVVQKKEQSSYNIVKAKENAFKLREKTLRPQLERDGKANLFVDARVGERNMKLTPEERALKRLQKELGKKKSIYNLGDDEGQSETLTHHGSSLDLLGKDDFVMSDDDESGDEMSVRRREEIDSLAFGGFENESADGPKSRDQRIREVILKSKMHKAERAKEKAHMQDVMESVNEQFNDVRSLLRPRPKISDRAESGEMDEYDKMVKELAFETRAHATDRLKTPEEIAIIEKEKLESLERDRRRRMNPEIEGNSKRAISADEIFDDYVVENASLAYISNKQRGQNEETEPTIEPDLSPDLTPVGSDDELNNQQEEEEEETETSKSKKRKRDQIEAQERSDEEEDDESSDDELIPDFQNKKSSTSFDSDDENEESQSKTRTQSKPSEVYFGKTIEDNDQLKDLPFVLEVPSSSEELQSLLHGRPGKDKKIIIHRILVSNHISASPVNKPKMEAFYDVLIDGLINGGNKGDMNEVDLMVRSLYDLTQQIPSQATLSSKQRVSQIAQSFHNSISEKGATIRWPSKGEILFLKLLSNLFPVTDYRHPVLTPAILILNEIITLSPIIDSSQLLKALFISHVIIHYMTPAKKYSPEVMELLTGVLATMNGESRNPNIGRKFLFVKPEEKVSSDLKSPLQPLSFFLIDSAFAVDSNFKMRCGLLVVKLLREYCKLLSASDSHPEIFGPVLKLIPSLLQLKPHSTLQSELKELSKEILEVKEEQIRLRKPLEFQHSRRIGLKVFNPRFEEKYGQAKAEKDKERKAERNMKKKLKKETKGAAKEIQKDSFFLQQEKLKKQQQVQQDMSDKRKRDRSIQEQDSLANKKFKNKKQKKSAF